MSQHNFQVNLAGIIDILAHHLYSDEGVFIRELLQNATDAIAARKMNEQLDCPEIEVELFGSNNAQLQLVVRDNGIGLTGKEVHEFLAVIGSSTKKDELLVKKDGFIGQFGIGLLSCFVVADEIVLVTKSTFDTLAVEWRGKADGTYTIKTLTEKLTPGTTIFISPKENKTNFFEEEYLKTSIRRYGNFLPFPIKYSSENESAEVLNSIAFPWENDGTSKEKLLGFAKGEFGIDFIDCFPIQAKATNTSGYVFICAAPAQVGQVQSHSIYLHRMFLSSKAEGLLPQWLFFAKCVLNSKGLRPTASRESFFEDDNLVATKAQLSEGIIDYFYELKEHKPDLLAQIINRHHVAIKLAAIGNETFFESICTFMPFETNMGTKTVREILDWPDEIYYVNRVDEFKKVEGIARNQNIRLVNIGYVYEDEFFALLIDFFPEFSFVEFDVEILVQNLTPAPKDFERAAFNLISIAEEELAEYGCSPILKSFEPAGIAAIYFDNPEMDFLREVEKSKEVSSDLFSGLLDAVASSNKHLAKAQLCLNADNDLVQNAASLKDKDTVKALIKVLYIQSLITGRHAVTKANLNTLTEALVDIVKKIRKEPNHAN